MSGDLKVTLSVLELMRESYSDAQDSFVLLEVSEHFQARKVLRNLTKISELLCEAVRKNSLEYVEDAKSRLEKFTLLNLRYLCQMRFKEIDWLQGRSKVLWWSLILQKPFKREDIHTLVRNAHETYDVGKDISQEFCIRSKSLRKCFTDLQEAVALIRPYRFYHHLFLYVLEGVFVLMGVALGMLLLG